MTLYHFTARRFLTDILQRGLALGAIPMSIDPPDVMPGYQWLTRNGNFVDQEWAEGTGRLPYRRDEARITVEIPKAEERNVIGRHGWSLLTPLAPDLCSLGDPDNWFVFAGSIPAAWLHSVVVR